MITVHHLNNSRSQRVLWLLEELGVDYEIVNYQRDAKTMLAPPALRRVHPLGKSPVITEGDTCVAESGAIIEYLVDRHDRAGALRPAPGTADFLRYRYWLHYAEGSAMPPLLMALVFSRLPQQPMPFFARPIIKGMVAKVMSQFIGPQLTLHRDFLEGELAEADWFVGNRFSAADIQMSFVIEALSARAGLGQDCPHLGKWLDRIHARPAWQRAIERGGSFDLMH